MSKPLASMQALLYKPHKFLTVDGPHMSTINSWDHLLPPLIDDPVSQHFFTKLPQLPCPAFTATAAKKIGLVQYDRCFTLAATLHLLSDT
jgi:hypothetical protein